MKKIFEVDELSKDRILAAYGIYKLKNKTLWVQYSYRKGNFNVYAFSENFHIGLNVDGDVIHQVFIKPETQDRLSKRYEDLEKRYIEKNKKLGEDIRESLFRKARRKINLAIDEFINRNGLYRNYIQAKKDQFESIQEDILKRIKEEEEIIDRLRTQRMGFRLDSDGNSNDTSIYLKVKAEKIIETRNGRERYHIDTYIEKNRNNLDVLLNSSDAIYPNDELSRSLFEYILIITYYTNNDVLFKNLFKTSTHVRMPLSEDDVVSFLKNMFSSHTERVNTHQLKMALNN